MGAKILTIITITIPLLSLGVMIYFILKQFGGSSFRKKCESSDDCHQGTYCTYNNVFEYNICEKCCPDNLRNQGNCVMCEKDSLKIGECPKFACNT